MRWFPGPVCSSHLAKMDVKTLRSSVLSANNLKICIIIRTMYVFYLRIVRLVDGATPYEGRVEVFHQCFWGYIANRYDKEWTIREANVVCRQLGFPSASGVSFHSINDGEKSTFPVFIDVQCDGDESSIDQCDHLGVLGWDYYGFDWFESVGVTCTISTPQPGKLT